MTAKPKGPAKATPFSQEVFDTICNRIAGGESLRSICRDADMPDQSSVIRWLQADQDDAGNDGPLRKQYARAREAQADAFVDEIVDIADTENDSQKARVRIDARKWAAGKARPKVYGDKVNLDHSGEISVTIGNKDADW